MSFLDQANPAIGLDVGTSRIVVARKAGQEYEYESHLNSFVAIPYSKMTESTLVREKILHTVQKNEIVVHGNDCERFADVLNTETRRTMTHGVVDPKEPDSVAIIRHMLDSLLSHPENANEKSRSKIVFTVPAAPLGAGECLTYHEATLKQILDDKGYEAKSINEGLAVVYGELESTNYTGIGISCGGGLCNVCLAYLSMPVVSFSIPKAGDYIDSSSATVLGERATRMRLTKEDSFHLNGFFADKLHQVISVYYDDVISSLVTALKDAFVRSSNMPKFNKPIPIVLAGGTALPKGFRDRFEKFLWEQDFPISISEIRLAQSPLHSTAKGALVCALTEN